MYNYIFNISVASEATIVGYIDHLAVIVVASARYRLPHAMLRSLGAIYRKTALRVCYGIRTISDEAVYVIAVMMLVNSLADGMMRIYDEFDSPFDRHVRNVKI